MLKLFPGAWDIKGYCLKGLNGVHWSLAHASGPSLEMSTSSSLSWTLRHLKCTANGLRGGSLSLLPGLSVAPFSASRVAWAL